MLAVDDLLGRLDDGVRQQGLEAAGLLVGHVVHAPEPAADDLLAQELAAERAQPQDVRDVVRVPALREHLHGDDAPHLLARLPRPPDGRDDLAQQLRRVRAAARLDAALRLRQQLAVDADRA